MKTLKVILKQHTPLIHFQHGQYGATLRASEVKPKLDRFLLEQLGIAISDKWLIGQDKKALNYKLRISSKIEKEYLIASCLGRNQEDISEQGINTIAPSPYFAQEKYHGAIARGNMSWDDIPCKGVMLTDIVMIFYTKYDDLVNVIAAKIQEFFLFENFGTRQNKGFGCFLVSTIDDVPKSLSDVEISRLLASHFQYCYYKTLPNDSFDKIFKVIVDDYRLLKSGNPTPYKKSKLMLYSQSITESDGNRQMRLRWEKKFFKEKLNRQYERIKGEVYELKCNPKFKKEVYAPINPQTEKYVYLRALLGVANQYEFLLENPPANNKKMIVSVNSQEVGRFKSPITFKVIGKSIYVVCDDISSEIFDKKFDFKMFVQEDNRNPNRNIICHRNRYIGSLNTPKAFDLGKFLDRKIMELGYSKMK